MLGQFYKISIACILLPLLLFGEEGGNNKPINDRKSKQEEVRSNIQKIGKSFNNDNVELETLHQQIEQEDKLLDNMKNKEEESIMNKNISFTQVDVSSKIVCEENKKIDPFVKWIFSGTDISMGAIFLSDVGTVISTFTANIGVRYNLSQKMPSMIAERGFSIAGRVGVAYLGYDTFRQNGVGIPVSAELSYVFQGGFLLSVGAEMIYAPIMGEYKESLSVEGYGEIGFADRSGGAIRIGYIFYSDALRRGEKGGGLLVPQKTYSPLKGNVSVSVHFKL